MNFPFLRSSGKNGRTSSKQRLVPPADWTPPEKSVFIVGTPRSGSTLLCSLMAQTGQLGNPDEFFKKKPYDRWELEGKDRWDMGIRCRIALSEGSTPNGVCCLKIFGYHMARIQEEISLFEWFPNSTFIWLHRRDLLAQAISFTIAKQTRRFHSYDKDLGIEPTYNAKHIYDRLEWLTLEEARWREYFARTNQPFIEMYYEDLVKDPKEHMIALSGRLGIEIPTEQINAAKSAVALQRNQINSEWRERFVRDCGDVSRIKSDWNPNIDLQQHRKRSLVDRILRRSRR